VEALRSDVDWSRWSLFGMGVLMVALGTAGPVKEAVAPLIGAGAALTAAGLIFPKLRSVDFGGIFKAELSSDEDQRPAVRTDVWKLQRFAWLVCGDATNARDLVEDALAETRAARLPSGARSAYTLQTLVGLLENVREHAWLRSPSANHRPHTQLAAEVVSEDCRPTMEALAELPVQVRIAYLLNCSWRLPVEEVVKVLGCSASDVSEAIAQGRGALNAQ
jgi:DNA-directed RNA polymerase specialized sigma24 family protein